MHRPVPDIPDRFAATPARSRPADAGAAHRPDLLRAGVRHLAWPLALLVAAAASAGVAIDPERAMTLQLVTLLAAVAIAVLAERLVPFRPAWRRGSASERRIDLTSLAWVMAVVDPLAKHALLPLVAGLVTPWLAVHGGAGWFPQTWPLPLQLLLAVLVAELGQYAMHRAAHRVRWLWAAHGFHHNPERLYWLNGFRVHPLNLLWHQLAGLGLLVALGTPAQVVQMVVPWATVVAVFQHVNADLRFSGWNRLFGTADLHRWHHDAGPGARGVNFGNVLMVWDQLFGTYRQGGAPERVGVDSGPARAPGYLAALREAWRQAWR